MLSEKTNLIFDMIKLESSCPAHIRIAAKVVELGHNRESFRQLIQSPEWNAIPAHFLFKIEESIKDLEAQS